MSDTFPTPSGADGVRMGEAQVLIDALLEGQITSAQMGRLDEMVCQDPEIRKYYIRSVHLRCGIPIHLGPPLSLLQDTPFSPSAARDPMSNAMEMPAITGDDALPVEEEIVELPRSSAPAVPPVVPRRWWNRWVVRSAAAILLAVAGAALWLGESHHSFARVVASTASFADASYSPAAGSNLPASPLKLKNGAIQFAFANGVQTTIEGPAEFSIDAANHLSLTSGKLWALVPHTAIGFTVLTPAGSVVDMGTEFGVSYDPDAPGARVEVFQGRVEAFSGSAATGGAAQFLGAGQSAVVSASAVAVLPQAASAQHFVRDLQPQLASLDVTDLISGGDGTTHRSISIDPGTGELDDPPRRDSISRRGTFHAVPAIPVLAGVFIPDGPTPIDGSGRRFAFPNSSGDYGMLWISDRMRFAKNTLPGLMPLNGINYLDDNHRHIWLHPNKGVTIDLQAVRRLHPLMNLSYFHCIAGNCIPRSLIASRKKPPKADFYVIVDGVLRFERIHFVPEDGGFAVDVPLYADDQSLTLASTDGGDGADQDYVVMADSQLN